MDNILSQPIHTLDAENYGFRYTTDGFEVRVKCSKKWANNRRATEGMPNCQECLALR